MKTIHLNLAVQEQKVDTVVSQPKGVMYAERMGESAGGTRRVLQCYKKSIEELLAFYPRNRPFHGV